MRNTSISVLTLVLIGALGCVDINEADTTPAMMDRGMVYILPGIQGVDCHYFNIRQGLRGAGLKCAIMIHPWGSQIPGIGMAINQTNTMADRDWGRKIAQDVAAYQRAHPDKRIYIIGQSGGGGVAVFAAEALASIPGAKPIEGLVLLDASISANCELAPALSMCNHGIVNYYNLSDVALLQTGTALFGNVDGGHGDSAGQTGFSGHFEGLYEVQVKEDMVEPLADPHFADTGVAFTTRYIAPWILEKRWPPRRFRHD
ncbi:MAG: alpha/beta fold hydrolase [Planctomycetota bacterium]|jgi:pimeloyl-ACP methyl ester carboxylesterase